jgi:hypothetical protein
VVPPDDPGSFQGFPEEVKGRSIVQGGIVVPVEFTDEEYADIVRRLDGPPAIDRRGLP